MATTYLDGMFPLLVIISLPIYVINHQNINTVANKINKTKKKKYISSLVMEEFIHSLSVTNPATVYDRAFVDMWRRHAALVVKRKLRGDFPRPYVNTSSESGGGRRKDRNRPVRWIKDRMVVITPDGRYRLAA